MDEYLAAIEDGLNRSLFFQIDSNVDKHAARKSDGREAE